MTRRVINNSTDLPVLLPFRPGAATWDARDWAGLDDKPQVRSAPSR
jgi:hypothetical protein